MPGSNGNSINPALNQSNDVGSPVDESTGGASWLNKIGNLGSPISALIGAVANIFMNERNNRANERLQAEANQRNIDLWRMQTNYNTPANQIARLKEAGLNPNLIYGSPNNTASAAPDMKAAERKASQVNPMDFVNALLVRKQLQMQDAEIANLEADTRQKNADAEEQEVLNTDTGAKIERDKAQHQQQISESQKRIEAFESQILNDESQRNVNNVQADLLGKELSLKSLELFVRQHSISASIEMPYTQINKLVSDIAKNNQDIIESVKRGELIDAHKISIMLHDYIDIGNDPYSYDIGNMLYNSLVNGYEYSDESIQRCLEAIENDESKKHNLWKIQAFSSFTPLMQGLDGDIDIFMKKIKQGNAKNSKEEFKRFLRGLKEIPVKGKVFKSSGSKFIS